MPIFFVSSQQIHAGRLTISGELHHHLWSSLRCRPGQELRVVDEARRGYRVRVVEANAKQVSGEILEELQPPRSSPRLILGQALLKGERMDWAIQKATELGVAEICPLVTAHAIVRPKAERLGLQRERWQRIALEAAQQSERWEVPAVGAPVEARQFFRRAGEAADTGLRLLLLERQESGSLARLALSESTHGVIVFVVGPEGGWQEEEVQSARAAGFVPVTLGPRILRAETAMLTALAVLQARLGELS